MANVSRVVKILAALFLITGCGTGTYLAPVDTREQPPSERISAHIVAKGETLYSIAWRYTLDVNELARRNGLREPYTLHPGQQLSLTLNEPYLSPSNKTTVNSNSVNSRSKSEPFSEPSKVSSVRKTSELRWRWPVQGRVVSGFVAGSTQNQGIDIGVEKGQPVLAAEDGTVVYAGSGLRGYGNLLIIKHTENVLSAYAHNDKLMATEGDSVKAGQKIAETGSSGTESNKLHFEIRLDGKPVNPLTYLPRQ